MKKFYFLFFTLIPLAIYSQSTSSIAIMDLDGFGVSKTEAKIITTRLRKELFNTNKFIILEREKMEDLLSEQGFQLSGCTSNECVVEAGQLLGVQKIVVGSVGKIGKIFTLTIRLIDVGSGKIINNVTVDCKCDIEDVFLKSVREVSQKLIGNFVYTEKNNYTTENKPVVSDNLRKPKSNSLTNKNIKSKSFYVIPKIGVSTITGIAGIEFQYKKVGIAYGVSTINQDYFEHYFGLKYFFSRHNKSSFYVALNYGIYNFWVYDELNRAYITKKDNFYGLLSGYRFRTIFNIEINIGLGYTISEYRFVWKKHLLTDFTFGFYL